MAKKMGSVIIYEDDDDGDSLLNNTLKYNELIWGCFAVAPDAHTFLNSGDAEELESFAFSDDLLEVFDWSETPQGYGFWENVYWELVTAGMLEMADELYSDDYDSYFAKFISED